MLANSPLFAAADTMAELNALIDQGRYEQVLAEIEARQNEGDSQPSLELLKGAVLVRSGKLDRAMAVFQSLSESHPNDAAVYNNIGVIHAEKGDMHSAREAFEKALKISPEYEQALYNLGDVYAELSCRTFGRIRQPQAGAIPGFCQSPSAVKDAERDQQVLAGQSDPIQHAGQQPDVMSALASWKESWMQQDVEAYLASYSNSYAPSGMTRQSWVEKRRRALKRPEWIRLELSDTKISMEGEQARVRFVQKYTASNYQDVVVKELLLGKSGDGWRILEERVL